jgi:Uma2 family endonuclease
LNKQFVLGVGGAAVVAPGCPVDIDEFSEPEPDLCVLRPRADGYRNQIPAAGDVLLLIEVSYSSLAFDLGVKRALYARASVAEYWIADVRGKCIRVFCEPQGGEYLRHVVNPAGSLVYPLAFPSLAVDVTALFP